METIEKAMIGGMTAIVTVVMLVQMAQVFIPQPQYACPICGQKFNTYDQLYQHFTTAHPSEPIDIIWE